MGIYNYNKMKLMLEIIILSCLFAISNQATACADDASSSCPMNKCKSNSTEDNNKCELCDSTDGKPVLKTDEYKATFDLSGGDFGACVATGDCSDGYFDYDITSPSSLKICMKCSSEYKKCKSTSGTTIEAAEG